MKKALSLVLGLAFAASLSAAPILLDNFTVGANAPGNGGASVPVVGTSSPNPSPFNSYNGAVSTLYDPSNGVVGGGPVNNGVSASYPGTGSSTATRTSQVNRVSGLQTTNLNIGFGFLSLNNDVGVIGRATLTYNYSAGQDWTGNSGLRFLAATDNAGPNTNVARVSLRINGIDVSNVSFQGSDFNLYFLSFAGLGIDQLSNVTSAQLIIEALNPGADITIQAPISSVIPEPSTYATLGAGLVLVGLLARRRK